MKHNRVLEMDNAWYLSTEIVIVSNVRSKRIDTLLIIKNLEEVFIFGNFKCERPIGCYAVCLCGKCMKWTFPVCWSKVGSGLLVWVMCEVGPFWALVWVMCEVGLCGWLVWVMCEVGPLWLVGVGWLYGDISSFSELPLGIEQATFMNKKSISYEE
ncbi:hypothetical protein HNY73_018983 [Argiope bruennichi]|uniref:Transmembrane protein n=1 Tax=Argiope bruennichi TaxID=94029 RepID=A0A8T0EG47_ARGBR|nr:hypothetical protein HNY73_018983 [Argiope bruennichi]